MTEQQSIKDTLNVIRKALEDKDEITSKYEKNDEVLILNQIIKEDGTINTVKNDNLDKNEIKEILNIKISELFDNHFEKWLDKNIPGYLDKYFKNK